MQEQDFKWFLQNYESLQKRYGDRFLAIKNNNVIGDYCSYAAGVRETMKTEPLGTFIIQECHAIGPVNQVCIASMQFV